MAPRSARAARTLMCRGPRAFDDVQAADRCGAGIITGGMSQRQCFSYEGDRAELVTISAASTDERRRLAGPHRWHEVTEAEIGESAGNPPRVVAVARLVNDPPSFILHDQFPSLVF